jgi:hypothetical protein
MIVLLIAALAVAALLAGGSWIARSRARQRRRRERLSGARQAAAAAEARAESERRRAAMEASDALTSVIPAIKMPWPTQPPGIGGHGDGYGDFRADYPAFSALAPFPAGEEPAGYAAAGYGPDGRGPDGRGPDGRGPDGRGPDGRGSDGREPVGRGPDGRGLAEFAAGYPGEQAAAPDPAAGHAAGAWPDERMTPPARPGERMVPSPRQGEHGQAADHPRRRAVQGSHRGGHGKRRRG